MWLRSLSSSLLFLLMLVPVRTADACGPDFPERMLADRVGALSVLPVGSFRREVRRLVPMPTSPFKVMEEDDEPPDARKGGGEKETALYEVGAKAFKKGDAVAARARFREVLALPAQERQRFSTFAAFMLGRNAGAGFEGDMKEGFELTRQLVREGFDDPLGLAVASYGEQARGLLEQGDDAGAIQLYAEQAAYGSEAARSSLFLVARALTRDETRLRAALKAEVVQRLMAVYVWTRVEDWIWEERRNPLMQVLEALAQATKASPRMPGPSIADKLAAGAWHAGRFDLAERFASVEKTPLAAWVQARLALRRGDTAAADKLLETAASQLDEKEEWMDWVWGEPQLRPYCRVQGERGVLALARGDFASATERALASCSWPDIAYLAERVLTVAELQRLVTRHPTTEEDTCKRELKSLWDDDDAKGATIPERLRLVLARRLLRAGKSTEALEYFKGTRWEKPAREYAAALATTQQDVSNVKKAEAFHEAAKLARTEGLGILGTEVAPDWGWVGGTYDMDRFGGVLNIPRPEEEKARKSVGKVPLMGALEKQRSASHAPPHPYRFHYRITASVLAQRGAELLPPRSQASAMMLCQAASYGAADQKRFEKLYWLYLRSGAAHGEGPESFGQNCQPPDFERAQPMKAPERKPSGP
ncbi:hypothetical protein MYSTI_06085 [Myxococcus stipitatus DSM 14675]|uniref:Lipoprotein n=1 Tax=Myxococcus stipitatus (strain DSM 14675 / JCM 12634 / Mx s8) TaxID=1278073 RepID=L7UH76_MYXSD|nr:hypothetical protein [Myxococcus stipitatus]AGC47358.1 hypothetical protein MYSTI_06085 [Myxococcus stipitatus DSM 14675]